MPGSLAVYFERERDERERERQREKGGREMDFVSAIKLRKIWDREKDVLEDTFFSLNSACSKIPGSEV
jgi:hypothetical protein